MLAKALQVVQRRGQDLGLKLETSKCELALPARDLAELFPERLKEKETGTSRVLLDGAFEFLGAAIGGATFCEAYMLERVQKSGKLLDELKQMEDPQVALRFLRNCAGVCKVTNSMCMTPPHLQSDQGRVLPYHRNHAK